MISIKTTPVENGCQMEFKMEGSGEQIVMEAVHIMQQIPRQLKDAGPALYFRFLAKMIETGDFGVAPYPEDESDEETENV